MNTVVAGEVTREEDGGQSTEETLLPRVRRQSLSWWRGGHYTFPLWRSKSKVAWAIDKGLWSPGARTVVADGGAVDLGPMGLAERVEQMRKMMYVWSKCPWVRQSPRRAVERGLQISHLLIQQPFVECELCAKYSSGLKGTWFKMFVSILEELLFGWQDK